jgi:hypothetical protein
MQTSAQMATEMVVRSLSEFLGNADYHRFCQLGGLEEGTSAEQKWAEFQILCKTIEQFDTELLAKIVDAGSSTPKEVGSLIDGDSAPKRDLNDL